MDTFESSFNNRRHGWEGLLSDEKDNLAVYFNNICGSDEPLRVHTVYLMENYRSTSNIVKAAQRVIGEEGEQENARQDMKPMRGSGPSPRVLACKNGKAEASFVVKTINSMVEAGDLSQSSTVALIYRTNAQSRLLEEACVEYNLRYVIRGSSGAFYRRQEVQDCEWTHILTIYFIQSNEMKQNLFRYGISQTVLQSTGQKHVGTMHQSA